MPSEEFSTYISEISLLLGKLDALIEAIPSGACSFSDCDVLIREGQALVHEAQLEARMSDSANEKKKMLQEVDAMKAKLARHKATIESAQLKSGSGGCSVGGKSAQDRSRMEAANDKLARQNEVLLAAQRTVAETEGVGAEIVNELAQNRSKIEGARDKVREVQTEMNDAQLRIDRMQKREKCVIA